MLELYLDSADVAQIRQLAEILPLAGVTTNPSILAAGGIGLNALLPDLVSALGSNSRIHVQVLSQTTTDIIAEAQQLNALPYDIVVKIPAHAQGLAAIKQLKQQNIPNLATAIYNVQQGFLAALNGADYLAPYLNRIDNLGFDGIGVVRDLQNLINQYQLPSKLLVASFKNVQQVLQVLNLGVASVTLPTDIARQMLNTPATLQAEQQFISDWQTSFGTSSIF